MTSTEPAGSWVNYILYDFWAKDADPYSAHLPLIGSSPWLIFFFTGLYLLLALKIVPDFMKNREPYQLQRVINAYNLFHIYTGSIFGAIALLITRGTYDCWQCKKTGDPNSLADYILLILSWYYFVAKFLDWLDTLFFCLRKKQSQVTFLHLSHHALMPFATYLCVKYTSVGRTSIIGIINTLVHSVMYTYYYLSSQPGGKNIWWKKYMTMIQLTQFLIFFIHGIQGLFFIDCPDFPTWVSVVCLCNTLFFIQGFTRFFFEAYKKPTKSA